MSESWRTAMTYLKPAVLTRRVLNPMAMRLGMRDVVTLTVAGRRTGKSHKVPVIPVEVGGCRYLVCPYGESEWVRNLRAAGGGELRSHGRAEGFTAVEVPLDDRAPIITRYREVAGRAVNASFAQLPDAADHPVFQVGERKPGPSVSA
jgi:deazaflavin-dependent oxidoreductase (nitroreductase family)